MIELYHALVVEDHEEASAWLVRALAEAFPQAQVTAVDSLAAARAAIASRVPDLALIDLGLPDGSGVTLVEEMNTRHPDTVTVVATVFEDDGHVFSALRAGARGYVLKDGAPEELVGLLTGILDGRPPLSPSIARRLLDYFHAPAADESVHLTERERDVLTLLAKGFTVKKVADLLDISPNTAAGYVKTIYRKLNISNRAQATLRANRLGLLSDDAD